VDWNTSIPEMRKAHEKTNKWIAKLPEGIQTKPVSIEEIHAEWVLPEHLRKDKVIFFTHGGGYVSGSCQDHRSIVAKLVKACDVRALQFDYRLAPEHPYPAAVEDSVTAYNWLLDQGVAPENIIIVGDSAGAGLALATLLALRDQGMPLPAAAVPISPWTDLTCSGESYRTKADVCLSPEGSWTVFGKYYMGDSDPTTPWMSPLFGELHDLPPLLIYTGDDEILRDDAIRFAEKAKQAGVDVTLRVGEKMVHCYPFLAPLIPEAQEAMDEICEFIQRKLRIE
jgi:acetyl esterase/lipase